MTIHPTTIREKPIMTSAAHGNRSLLEAPELGSGGNNADMIALLIFNSKAMMSVFA